MKAETWPEWHPSSSLESARLFGVATQKVSYDSQIVAQYAQAKADGNTRLQQFYRQSLIRRDFLPVLDRWEAMVSSGESPARLTEDPEYLAAQLADYDRAVAAAKDSANASNQAGDVADEYVAITILLASSLFFAGVTSSFRYRPARAFLLHPQPRYLRHRSLPPCRSPRALTRSRPEITRMV